MNRITQFSLALMLCAALIVPSSASAATTAELQSQLAALFRQITEIQTQLKAQGKSVSTTPTLSAKPTCTMTATPDTAEFKERVKVSWTSSNAKTMTWVRDTSGKDNLRAPKGKARLAGSRNFKMDVLGNPSLTMRATGPGGTTTCSVTIPVEYGEEEDEDEDQEDVSCVLSTDKRTYEFGETIRFTWSGSNATSGAFVMDDSGKDSLALPGDKLDGSGTAEVEASVYGNPVVKLRVLSEHGSGWCTTSFRIQ